MVLFEIFASIFFVSLISLVGVFTLSMKEKSLKKWLLLLVSFSAGALLGDVFFHLLPETAEEFGFSFQTGLSVLAAILVFFVLENIIKWHHHHHVEEKEEEVHSFGYVNLLGDALHNFLDGMIIAGSYLVNAPLGIATTIAVILHEIPQEIGDFGILLHSGFSVKKALKFNFLSALTAVVGGIVGVVFTSQVEGFSAFLLPFTAGSFIYLAGTDLLPEIKKENKGWAILQQFLAIVLGMAMMAGLLLLE